MEILVEKLERIKQLLPESKESKQLLHDINNIIHSVATICELSLAVLMEHLEPIINSDDPYDTLTKRESMLLEELPNILLSLRGK